MAKLKKQLVKELTNLRVKYGASLVMLFAVSMFLVVGGVAAKDMFSWDSVESKLASLLAEEVSSPEEAEPMVGAMVSPIRYNQVECDNDWCTAVVTVEATDASTTIFAVAPPFRAATSTGDEVVVESAGRVGWTVPTSSLDLVAINVKGAATTTYSVMCSSAETKFATSSASLSILETGTSVSSTPYLENNISAANADGGYLTGTIDKIFVTPQRPYVICKVNAADDDAFTNDENTFDADASFRFRRLQR